MSRSLILPCWSSCTIVGITVEVLVCVRSCSLICLLPWTPISIMPSLTTTIARSHNTRILYSVVSSWWRRCRARRLKVGVLNLTMRSLESLHCNLHPLLVTQMENRSLRERTITKLLVASLRSSGLQHRHPTNLQQVQPTNVLQIEPFLCWCIEPLAVSSQLSSTKHWHPLVRQSERMLEAWSAGIL
jgi:hypothetical protein